MAVTARFIVSRLTPLGGGRNAVTKEEIPPWGTEVEMTPDYSQGRNEEWKHASPSGVFRLSISQDKPALSFFEVGKHLHIVISEAEDE